ncbi:nucleotide exchange factor GrpE [Glaciecola sp. 2405UD65-10]|uniref:nucleotide exchange factor GrpE n=1 Tax=Glaciecola sp. 2405UD65-10 TaxID=3397244 RepID=UPI003B5A1A36
MNQDNVDKNEPTQAPENAVEEVVSGEVELDQGADEQGLDWKAYADELEAKLSAAEATIEAQKDSVLRAKADGENARRRAEQEIDKARKFALEKFAGELLNVVDNLERATLAADAENEAVKSLLEGVEMTHKSFISTFEKFGLETLDPQGEAFNPEHHQAMSMQESDEVAPNTVLAVMQKGYVLNGRLLRPAMVMVSRGGSNSVDTQA